MGTCFSRPTENGPPSPQMLPISTAPGVGDNNHFHALANHRRMAQMNVYRDDSIARKMTQGSMYHFMPQQNGTISSNGSRNQSSPKVIALYAYESRVDGDISFKKDDVMIVLEET